MWLIILQFYNFTIRFMKNSIWNAPVNGASAGKREDYIGYLFKVRNIISGFSNLLYDEDFATYIKYHGEKDNFGLIYMNENDEEDPIVLSNKSIYDWYGKTERMDSKNRRDLYDYFFFLYLSWKSETTFKNIKKFTLMWSESILRYLNELIKLRFIRIEKIHYNRVNQIYLKDGLLPINKARFDKYDIKFKMLKIDFKLYEFPKES